MTFRLFAGTVALLCFGCANVPRTGAPATPPAPASYPALDFADIRTVAVEVAFPKEEACTVPQDMEALDRLTHKLKEAGSVEGTYSLSSAARIVNKALNDNNPRFDVIPKNKYVLLAAITPIPLSSHLLNEKCDKLWIEATLDRSAFTVEWMAPGFAEKQIAQPVKEGLEAELVSANQGKNRWRSLQLQQKRAIVTVVVKANDGDILTPAALRAARTATDSVFYLPGTDRSTVKSLFTPDVRWFEVVGGALAGGAVIPSDAAAPPKGEILRRLALSPNGKGLVSSDGASTLVVSTLLLQDPVNGAPLNFGFALKALERSMNELRRDYGATATFTPLVIMTEAASLPCDTRDFGCAGFAP